MMDKAILTCALTGVLTNPSQHPVPVTPEQMAQEARDAFNAGASVMHVHLRQQEEGKGHLPSWDPEVAAAVVSAIREACPGVIINLTTGVVGKDVSGPLACIRRIKPEIAACNAGSLNYLKIRDDGQWAWPPMVFDNPVTKVQQFLDVMQECGVHPEFECFDVGIVRSVGMYLKAGMLPPELGRPEYNLMMGVASGMPCDADLLALLLRWMAPDSVWQTTLIGRAGTILYHSVSLLKAMSTAGGTERLRTLSEAQTLRICELTWRQEMDTTCDLGSRKCKPCEGGVAAR